MKSLLSSYASYNTWANDLLVAVIRQLSPEQQQQEVPSSFTSLQKTLLHMLDAESIWWQRLKLQEHIKRPSESIAGGMDDIIIALKKQDKQWQEWVAGATEHMLDHEFIYQNTKREQFKQPTWQMLLHLFNHATYHRGQLVNMLRQLGVEKIPSTDYIGFSRKK